MRQDCSQYRPKCLMIEFGSHHSLERFWGINNKFLSVIWNIFYSEYLSSSRVKWNRVYVVGERGTRFLPKPPPPATGLSSALHQQERSSWKQVSCALSLWETLKCFWNSSDIFSKCHRNCAKRQQASEATVPTPALWKFFGSLLLKYPVDPQREKPPSISSFESCPRRGESFNYTVFSHDGAVDVLWRLLRGIFERLFASPELSRF